MRFWGPSDIFDVPCPDCGEPVEFFKDDAQRKCKKCQLVIYNPRNNFGCANWCPAARECLGPERHESLRKLAQKEIERKNDMENLLGGIPLHEAELRLFFKCLYLKQGNPDRLFDTEDLKNLKTDNPKLFEKAVHYYQDFRNNKK